MMVAGRCACILVGVAVFYLAVCELAAQTPTWVQKLACPSGRSEPAMAYDAERGQVVLFGGYDGAARNDTWVWGGSNWSLRNPVSSPPGRRMHALAYDAARKQVVLFGGDGYTGAAYRNDTWVWDGTNWTPKAPATSPAARVYHAMAYDAARGQVVLFGGYDGSDRDDTWVWDGNGWTLKNPADRPPARSKHAMAYDAARGQVVLFGGYRGWRVLGDTWVWDGSNWSQKTSPLAPNRRADHALAYDAARAQVVLFGGTSAEYVGPSPFPPGYPPPVPGPGPAGPEYGGDTWVWDGNNWTRKSLPASPTSRHSHAMAYDAARGQVLLFGGWSQAYLSDTWAWDGSNWSRKSVGGPAARFRHAMAYDAAHGRVVLFSSEGAAADTWVWDGSYWAKAAPAVSPPARWGSAMAYDVARGQMVIFGGGTSQGGLGDTWVWDGSNWSQKNPAASPPARSDHAMAYDAARAQVVLFGGLGGLTETWVWDGSNWTRKTPATSPPGRWSHALAYDATRGQVLLFGGCSPRDLGDTWVWDGSNWTQKSSAASPPARYNHALAYDATRGQVVLFGGESGRTPLGDTWLWDGANWTRNAPPTSPPARMGHAMAYDAARAQVVLFGGMDASAALSDTWVWGAAPLPGTGAAPVISPGGAVNAAGYALGKPLAPGSIAALFGNQLASGTAIAEAPPLPTLLGGSRVTLNGIAAPLFYVSPGQINFQVPWELAGQTQASVLVSVDGASSTAERVSLASYSPGIFLLDPSGQGAVVVASTGEVAAPSGSIPGLPARPVKRGEYVSIYCTGLGPVTDRPASGAVSPSSPLSTTTTTPSVTIGGMPAAVSFSGLAPGFVGLYQVNVQAPADARTGSSVPVVLAFGGVTSNTVTIAVE